MKSCSVQKEESISGDFARYKYFHYTYWKTIALRSAKTLFYWIVTLDLEYTLTQSQVNVTVAPKWNFNV